MISARYYGMVNSVRHFAVDKWRSQGTGDNYNDDIYVCGTAYFVHVGWKLQRKWVLNSCYFLMMSHLLLRL